MTASQCDWRQLSAISDTISRQSVRRSFGPSVLQSSSPPSGRSLTLFSSLRLSWAPAFDTLSSGSSGRSSRLIGATQLATFLAWSLIVWYGMPWYGIVWLYRLWFTDDFMCSIVTRIAYQHPSACFFLRQAIRINCNKLAKRQASRLGVRWVFWS